MLYSASLMQSAENTNKKVGPLKFMDGLVIDLQPSRCFDIHNRGGGTSLTLCRYANFTPEVLFNQLKATHFLGGKILTQNALCLC